MRRVVVTGLGMVTPLGCGVETTWKRLLAGQSGAQKIEKFNVEDLAAKIACPIPRGDGSDGTYNPDQWMEPKEQRRVDDFIVYAMCAARQAIEQSGWKPTSREDQIATGVMIGSGIGGHRRHRRDSACACRQGPAPRLAVLHPGPDHQSRVGLCVDRVRPQGAEPRGCDGVLDRRTRDRRFGAADRARRRRRDGGGRYRVADQPAVDGRICRLPRAVDQLQ